MAWKLLRLIALVMCIFTAISCAFMEGVFNPAQPSQMPPHSDTAPPGGGQIEEQTGNVTSEPTAESAAGEG